MSFLHCHNCSWSQDDFWNFTIRFSSTRPFGYNPISLIWEDIFFYLRPRYIEMDSMWCHENGFKNPIFSWKLMLWEIKRHLKEYSI